MRTLYLDCGMGAAGDMLAAALLELHPQPEVFVEGLNRLGFPGVEIGVEKSVKCGITGLRFFVKCHGQEEGEDRLPHHSHGSMAEIRRIVTGLKIPGTVKLDILTVFGELAQAESLVHGVPVEQIHFHEVGSLDAIVDITAVSLLMAELKFDRVVASPVHVGSGTVRCAHGVLPVPAPATAELLKGIPIYGGSIQSELCTPTGAALLKHFVTEFGEMPTMEVEQIGYGMGKKDFPRANCLRLLLGETREQAGEILELSCNLDDMTPEEVGFALELLLQQGALDAFTVPIGMKKSRPGVMLTVLCHPGDRQRLVSLLFRHTTTLGIREKSCRRHTLQREIVTEETTYGQVRKKVSRGYGVCREKWEYEDLARIAKEKNLSLRELKKQLKSINDL